MIDVIYCAVFVNTMLVSDLEINATKKLEDNLITIESIW